MSDLVGGGRVRVLEKGRRRLVTTSWGVTTRGQPSAPVRTCPASPAKSRVWVIGADGRKAKKEGQRAPEPVS